MPLRKRVAFYVLYALLAAFGAVALLKVPAPWSEARTIAGTVLRADVVQGGGKFAGTRGSVTIGLDDGTTVFIVCSRRTMPQLSAKVTVHERYGLLGQRLVTLH
jgi:hypothetical protein